MWTPRRLLLLLVGFFLFGMTYTVYGRYVGGINGLPPLPPEYWQELQQPHAGAPYSRPPVSYVVTKLEMAFGKDCDEVKHRAIMMEVGARRLYLASNDFSVLEDGRAKFVPFSIAIFGKPRADGGYPEINTIRCDEAIIQFDKPLTNSAEQVGDRKIVGGVLNGNVKIVNNRRTPQRDDDMSLYTQGPIYYEEGRRPAIWTQAVVELEDVQSKPEPMQVTANGMDLYLVADDKPPPAGQPQGHKKPKSENITGIERIHLRADVTMTLFVDSHSGFLGSDKQTPAGPPDATPAKAAEAPAQPSKAKVVVRTQGPFDYDMIHDVARFSISRRQSPWPDRVIVTRYQDLKRLDLHDELDCDDLELHFHRKGQAPPTGGQPSAPAGAADQSVALEIETAHATGTQVTLVSDSEGLAAFGNDLAYDAKTHETVLKGEKEMLAMKEGNEIHARELHLIGGDRKEAQGATGTGPGWIAMLDSKTGTRPIEAHWEDKLIWAKDGIYDVLTLTGNASFLQRQQKPPSPGPDIPPDPSRQEKAPIDQELEADRLKVWLKPAAPGSAGGKGEHHTPHHLDAAGHVRATSADMHVHDTDHLEVWFKDVEGPLGPPPQAEAEGNQIAADGGPLPPQPTPLEANNPGAPAVVPPGASTPGPPAPQPHPGAAAAPAAAKAGPNPTAEKPKKPMDVSARSIEAHVLRSGTKNELDKLRCEGTVHVTQEPSGPDDKGVDIRGETLKLDHFPEQNDQPAGNVLVVTASPDKARGELAYVQLDKITMIGPVVNIDQVANKAWVDGVGSMKMPSQSDFEGQHLNQPKDLTVHWSESMVFDGKFAEFLGGVQAEMDLPEAEKRKLPPGADIEVSRLVCQRLDVYLDRAVSLRQDERKAKTEPAKVDHLVCDQRVRVEESTFRLRKLQEYKRIVSTELSLENKEGIVTASGPGVVHILQMGAKGEDLPMAPSPQKPATPAKPGEEELKLTRVSYEDRLFANNLTHTAIFYGNVEVTHLAADDPDVPVDPTKPLPKGAMVMRCEQLKVQSCKNPDGKTTHQEMEANRRVLVQSQEFWARADHVTYDESKELVIFEGLNGNQATLYRENGPEGAPRGEVRSKKIYYWRRTNDFKTEESQHWQSQ